ncbi:MAG: Crp/Fnr family transcriptional regulator [Leptolyngbya sp. BL-A-14]
MLLNPHYESLLSSQPSKKSIQALESCSLLVATYENFQLIYQQFEEGERLGRLLLETVFVKIIQQLTSLYQDLPEERYKIFLENFSDVQQRIPQYYVASYVGVKPQSLSRIRRRLGL